jgi:hypothetical protein
MASRALKFQFKNRREEKMLKKVIISGLMAVMLGLNATFANAGIIILKDGNKSTSTTSTSTSSSSTGIIVLDATGIIILLTTTVSPDGIIIL